MQPYRALVIGSGPVVAIQTGPITLLKVFVFFLRVKSMKGKMQLIGLVSTSVNAANGVERRIGTAITAALIALIDSHNLESEGPDVDRLTYQVGYIAGGEFLCLIFIDDQDLARQLVINLIDEASVTHFQLIDSGFVGIDAVE